MIHPNLIISGGSTETCFLTTGSHLPGQIGEGENLNHLGPLRQGKLMRIYNLWKKIVLIYTKPFKIDIISTKMLDKFVITNISFILNSLVFTTKNNQV